MTFSTPIVTTTEKVTNIMVKRRYLPEKESCLSFVNKLGKQTADLPKRGTDMEVGGIISARSKKNTVSESRMEMDNDTFSPESDGKWNTSTERNEMPTHGMMTLTV